MAEEKKPDYAPKSYEMPKMDFSDAKLEKPAETKAKTYTVDSGDNLSNIAKQELGDANRWREIYDLKTHLAGLPSQDVRPRGFEAAMELVEPHVVVPLRPALLAQINAKHEHRVDQLRIPEVVASKFILRTDRIDPGGTWTRRPSAERDAHYLAGEAAFDELSPRRSPAVEARVVERTLLEARSLGRDVAHVRAVELARHERAPRSRHEERRELLIEAQAAEVARDEVGDGEIELVEARLPEIDVREPGAAHRNDAGLNVVRLRCAVLLGHSAPG